MQRKSPRHIISAMDRDKIIYRVTEQTRSNFLSGRVAGLSTLLHCFLNNTYIFMLNGARCLITWRHAANIWCPVERPPPLGPFGSLWIPLDPFGPLWANCRVTDRLLDLSSLLLCSYGSCAFDSSITFFALALCPLSSSYASIASFVVHSTSANASTDQNVSNCLNCCRTSLQRLFLFVDDMFGNLRIYSTEFGPLAIDMNPLVYIDTAAILNRILAWPAVQRSGIRG